MAWTFLAEWGGFLSPWLPGSGQLPIVRSINTVSAFCFPEWPWVGLKYPLFGMTYGPYEESVCPPSTSSMVASHAKTLALLGAGKAWVESRADWYSRRSGLSMSLDRPSFSWKTFQRLEPEEQPKFARDWPSAGMTLGSTAFRLTKWARRTDAIDGSCLLPTPSASNYGTNKGGAAGRVGKVRPSLNSLARLNGATINPAFVEWMMGYPAEWTVCADWAMPSSPVKRAKRSKG